MSGFYRTSANGPEIPLAWPTVTLVDENGIPTTGGGGGGGLSSAQTTAAVQNALESASTLDQLETYMLSDPDFNSDILRDSGGTPFRLLRTETQGGTATITYETLDNPPAPYTPTGSVNQWSSFDGGNDLELVTRRYTSTQAIAGTNISVQGQWLEQQVTKDLTNNSVVREEWYNLSIDPDLAFTTAQVTALKTPDLDTNTDYQGESAGTGDAQDATLQQIRDRNIGENQIIFTSAALGAGEYQGYLDHSTGARRVIRLTDGAEVADAVVVRFFGGDASSANIQSFLYDVVGGNTGLTGYVKSDLLYPTIEDAIAETNALTIGLAATNATNVRAVTTPIYIETYRLTSRIAAPTGASPERMAVTNGPAANEGQPGNRLILSNPETITSIAPTPNRGAFQGGILFIGPAPFGVAKVLGQGNDFIESLPVYKIEAGEQLAQALEFEASAGIVGTGTLVGATIEVFNNAASLGTTTVLSDGTWAFRDRGVITADDSLITVTENGGNITTFEVRHCDIEITLMRRVS